MLHTEFVEISNPVFEMKVFEGFLPYKIMGIAAIHFMRPGCREEAFVPPTLEGSK